MTANPLSSELLALAAKVEALTGPDREVDCLIYEMDALRKTRVKLNLTPKMRGTYYGEPTGRYFDISGLEPVELPYVAQLFTASIDAAMTVCPDGCFATFDPHFMDDEGVVRFRGYVLRPDWPRWHPSDGDAWIEGRGTNYPLCATPALALTAASLRAIAAQQGEG